MTEETEYDIVIIGSGMGGLSCGNILSQNGKRIIILEQDRQIGGNLQVFSRDGCVFDTGVHYVGGLDEGQILYRLFDYFGIIKDLKLKRMDADGFDRLHFNNEEIYYKYGMGYEKFKNNLYNYFPNEKDAIDKYCSSILNVVNKLPLAKLEFEDEGAIPEIDFGLNAKEYINSLTTDIKLQKVFAGNNALYAGSLKTPFYVHALVLHYYIESSWRCVDGAAQIAKLMSKKIRSLNGVIKNRAKVVGAEYDEGGNVKAVKLSDGTSVRGKAFISNIHPSVTVKIFGKERFKKNYVGRINSLKNTGGMFVLHLVLKSKQIRYFNYNIFQLNNEDVWDLKYDHNTWPSFYMITTTPDSKDPEFAKGLSVITGMSFEEVERWKDTYNNVTDQRSRGESYERFKKIRSEVVIDAINIHFPGIREKIRSYTSSTPLTQRDYTASPEGSGYGIEKDSDNPFKTIINTKTTIPNLYLTGQNLTLHGILGVSLTALLTCFNFVNKEELIEKINSKT